LGNTRKTYGNYPLSETGKSVGKHGKKPKVDMKLKRKSGTWHQKRQLEELRGRDSQQNNGLKRKIESQSNRGGKEGPRGTVSKQFR